MRCCRVGGRRAFAERKPYATLRRVERQGGGGRVVGESAPRVRSKGRLCVLDWLLSITATINVPGPRISHQEADVCRQTALSEGVTGEGLDGQGGWGWL